MKFIQKIKKVGLKLLYIKNQILFLVILLFIQLTVSSIIVFFVGLYNIQQQLNQKIRFVREDVRYINGKWILSSYNADPRLLGIYPLYFITTDGFVLDRRSPISGFLDISDYKRLLSYQKIQTTTFISGQPRRVYSQPIYQKENIIGVIAVSYVSPQNEIISQIDKKLTLTIDILQKRIIVRDQIVDTYLIDERKIPNDVAFIVVDRFNTILKKTTNVNSLKRIPNFIDSSYIKEQLETQKINLVKDKQTGDFILTQKEIIKDKDGLPLSIIIIGSDIKPIINLVFGYIYWNFFSGIVILLAFVLMISYYQKVSKKEVSNLQILFDAKNGLLIIKDKKIKIPYATNQFYLLQALFQNPSKRWETGELLEKFGEEVTNRNWRKVYDAMIKVNKKTFSVVPIQLIINQNKTYKLNSVITLPQKTH